MSHPGIEHVFAARKRLQGRLRRTPLVPSASLSATLGQSVYLKLEHTQLSGSFKLRGATNAIENLGEEARARGVVGVSTGNHGRGLAVAAKQAGVRAIVCMSELVPQNKVEGIRAQGAEVRIVGRSQDDAQREVDKLVADGMVMVSPFDDPDVIAGQGTLGLEIVEEMPDLEQIVVPLSGGGLLAGVALAVKAISPSARVVGVTMERGAAMHLSVAAGRPVEVEELATIADALGGGIGMDNRYTLPMLQELMDDSVLVSEQQIADAVCHAYREERQIVEGSGAVGIAAIKAGLVPAVANTVVVLSGGNIDMQLHHRIISGDYETGS